MPSYHRSNMCSDACGDLSMMPSQIDNAYVYNARLLKLFTMICMIAGMHEGRIWNLFLIDRGPNYFARAGQNVRQAFSALPDILSRCQTFFPVDELQMPLVILVFLVRHFMCFELCWTKCPARSELSAGHQQKSAGHVRHISRSLFRPWRG